MNVLDIPEDDMRTCKAYFVKEAITVSTICAPYAYMTTLAVADNALNIPANAGGIPLIKSSSKVTTRLSSKSAVIYPLLDGSCGRIKSIT